MVAFFQEAIKLLILKYWSYMYIQQFSNNIIDVPWYLQNLMYSFQIGKFTRFYEIGLLPNVFKEMFLMANQLTSLAPKNFLRQQPWCNDLYWMTVFFWQINEMKLKLQYLITFHDVCTTHLSSVLQNIAVIIWALV